MPIIESILLLICHNCCSKNKDYLYLREQEDVGNPRVITHNYNKSKGILLEYRGQNST
jgi:hypothetical protein